MYSQKLKINKRIKVVHEPSETSNLYAFLYILVFFLEKEYTFFFQVLNEVCGLQGVNSFRDRPSLNAFSYRKLVTDLQNACKNQM